MPRGVEYPSGLLIILLCYVSILNDIYIYILFFDEQKTPFDKIYNTPTLPKVPHIELYTTPEPEEVCTHDVLHTPLIYPRSLKSSTLHSNYQILSKIREYLQNSMKNELFVGLVIYLQLDQNYQNTLNRMVYNRIVQQW